MVPAVARFINLLAIMKIITIHKVRVHVCVCASADFSRDFLCSAVQ